MKKESLSRRHAVAGATAASTYCPFCRDDLGVEDLHTCARCNTRFHNECWGELGENCMTLGCAARRAVRLNPRPAPAPAPARNEFASSELGRAFGLLCADCGGGMLFQAGPRSGVADMRPAGASVWVSRCHGGTATATY